jgi:hypothetical protein
VKDVIAKFLKVFDGYENAYGQYGGLKEKDNGKVSGHAQTITGPIPNNVAENHLKGISSGLGIVPLKSDNTVRFGAIDLDIVGVGALTHTIDQIENKVTRLGLPLVCCTTKSNGIHLYCFTSEPISAELMIKRLKEWATYLGYGSSEIFPKQSYRLNENDIGNWINLPYFGGDESNRFCVNKNKKASLAEFFDFVEVVRMPKQELENFKVDGADEEYNDAPPCLQILKDIGIEEGSRNNGAFSFAVYLKKKDENNWQNKLEELNSSIISPPLMVSEIDEIKRSVDKRDFFYKCSEYPLIQYCNKAECKKRKYGIGQSSEFEMFRFDHITKYNSGDEVWWFAEYQGQRIQLTTEEILMQVKLQTKLLEKLNIVLHPVKNAVWLETIKLLINDCVEVKEPEQASRKGQFFELFDSFLCAGAPAEKKDDLMKFNTYIEGTKIHFRGVKLFSFLKNKKFKHSEREIWNWLKDEGAESKKIKVAKKSINVWVFDSPEQFDLDPDEEKI